MPVVHIGLGSNLGDRRKHIASALIELSKLGPLRSSGLFETAPVELPSSNWFLNGAVELATALGPFELLEFLQSVELACGRTERADRARTLDLDILFYGTLVMTARRLVLPHPRLHQRTFVLLPLIELTPDLRHPVIGLTIAELTAQLPQTGIHRCADA